MIRSRLRDVLCWTMVALIPAWLNAADSGAAMLYAKGTVTVDGNQIKDSSAVFPGNIIETKPDSVANLNVTGSTVMLQPETVVKFQGSDIYLDHGSLSVASSSQLRVHVKCITANPLSTTWTQFDVADVQGTVQIVAHKGDVGINYTPEFSLAKATTPASAVASAKPAVTLSEGQQFNRYEREGCPMPDKAKSVAAASNGIQHSPAVQIIAGAAGGGVLIWVLTRGGNPISPTNP